jgi:uncharacterized protein (DUF111 family)
METLMEIGAKDVFFTSIQMKKIRPAVTLSVLTDHSMVSQLEQHILKETTTFGLRKYDVSRTILNRTFKKMKTPYGEITVKCGYLENTLIKAYPEYEELKLLSKDLGITLINLYSKVTQLIQEEFF